MKRQESQEAQGKGDSVKNSVSWGGCFERPNWALPSVLDEWDRRLEGKKRGKTGRIIEKK